MLEAIRRRADTSFTWLRFSMVVKTINPPGVPQPPPTYNQVAMTELGAQGKLITLAGQTGLQVNGEIASDFINQVDVAYENVQKALQAAGGTLKDIVHVRHYIVVNSGDPDLDKKDVVDRGWGEKWIAFMDRHADGHRPPDTVLGVAALAKKALLYEVECWAYVPEHHSSA